MKPKAHIKTRPSTMLELATDWKSKFDLCYDEVGIKHRAFFPEHILVTGQIPDGVVWSESKKIIYLLELSCSWEEWHADVHVRKKRRYADMEAQLTTQDWTVLNLPFKVGSCGYLSLSVN